MNLVRAALAVGTTSPLLQTDKPMHSTEQHDRRLARCCALFLSPLRRVFHLSISCTALTISIPSTASISTGTRQQTAVF